MNVGNYSAKLRLTIEGIQGGVREMQSLLNTIKVPSSLKTGFENVFKGLDKNIAQYQKNLNLDLNKVGNVDALKRNVEEIQQAFKEAGTLFTKLTGKSMKFEFANIDLNKLKDINTELQRLTTLQKELTAIKEQTPKQLAKIMEGRLPDHLVKKEFEVRTKQIHDLVTAQEKLDNATSLYKGEVAAAKKTGLKKQTEIDAVKEVAQAKALVTILTQIRDVYSSADTAQQAFFTRNKLANEDALRALQTFTQAQKEALISGSPEQMQAFFDQFNSSFNKAKSSAASLREELNQIYKSAGKKEQIASQFQGLTSQLQYTFSLMNSFYIAQRVIKSAYQSVKELDASMNEIAVVTEMTTADLWDQIDAYNKLASAMGATVKGSYDVAKLYYQQGKSTKDVNTLTTETLKLARISGLEYGQATDFMTSALNGFKLEVKDASRVSDIYSNLAAKAAVDTQEIAYAMTKTASIAKNAGMSIENTAAMLTQMMETTREAPENIGTAMKTIIARFAEMKEAIGNTFTDENGEVVNVNRVDKALKTAGVQLRDSITGEIRPIDEVFLELSSKWDGLTKNTQRYIATIAAGSRQQSRFIALMDNYKRTLELVDIATNSSGAADEQFNKTLDSLESKLNKLSNAWIRFTTGITDAQVIKGSVDILTGFLTIINTITEAVPGMSGFFKTTFGAGGFVALNIIISKLVANFQALTTAMGSGLPLKEGFQNFLVARANKKIIAEENLRYKQQRAKILEQAAFSTDINLNSTADYNKQIEDLEQEHNATLAEAEYNNDHKMTLERLKNQKLFLNEKAQIEQKAQIDLAKNLDKLEQDRLINLNSVDILPDDEIIENNKKIIKEMDDIKIKSANDTAEEIRAIQKKYGVGEIVEDGVEASTSRGLAALKTFKKGLVTFFTGIGETIGGGLAAGVAAVGVFAAVIAGLTAAAIVIYNQSPAKLLKDATEATITAKNAADLAGQSYETLLSSIESHNQAVDTLNTLTEGTLEFKAALLDANAAMLSLINQYGLRNITGSFETMSNGAIVLTSSGEEYTKNLALINKEQAQNVAYTSQSLQLERQRVVDIETFIRGSYEKYSSFQAGAVGQQKEEGFGYVTPDMIKALINYVETNNIQSSEQDFWNSPIVRTILGNAIYTTDDKGNKVINSQMISELQAFTPDLYQFASSMAMNKSAQQANYAEIGRNYLARINKDTDVFAKMAYEAAALTFEGQMTAQDINRNKGDYSKEALRRRGIDEDNYEASLRKDYAAKMGKYYNESDQQIYDYAGGTKLEGFDTLSDIKNQLVSMENTQQLENETVDILTALSTFNNQSLTKLAKAPKAMSGQDFEDLGVFFTQQAANLKNMSEAERKAFEASIYITEEQFQNRKNAAEDLLTILYDTDATEAQLNLIQNRIPELSEENMIAMSSMISGLNRSFDKSIANNALSDILNSSTENLSLYAEAINKVDYSNSITTFSTLTSAIKTTTGAGRAFLQNQLDILTANKSEKQLFQDLYTSDNFDEAINNLDKLYKANGKITGTDIKDLAKEVDILDQYLTNSEVSASALATVFEAMTVNDLGLESIDDALLAAVASASQLKTALDGAFDTVDNKKWERSLGDVGKFASETAGDILGSLEKGMIGDPRLWEQLKFMFPESDIEALSTEISTIMAKGLTPELEHQEIYKALKPYGEVLARIQKEGNLSALWEGFNKDRVGTIITPGENKGFTAKVEANRLKITDVTGTTADVLKQLQNEFKVTDEMAQLMLADLLAYSDPAIQKQLEGNDWVAGKDKWTAALQEQAYISQAQIDIMKMLYKDYADEIQAAAEATGKAIVDTSNVWGNDTKTNIENLIDALSKTTTYGENTPKTIKDIFSDNKGMLNPLSVATGKQLRRSDNNLSITRAIDADEAIAELVALGATTEEASNALDEMAKTGEQGFNGLSRDVTTFNDGVYTTTTLVGSTVKELDAAETKMRNDALAASIAKAIGTIEVTINGNTAELKTAINQAVLEGNQKVITIKITGDPSPINETLAQIGGKAPENAAGTGIQGASTGGLSTVAERGYEIVQNSSGAWLAGLHGQETTYLNRGDIVYNHAMSREILAGKKAMRRFATSGAGYRGPALLAEEGYELVQTATGAYLAGMSGPEVTNLNPKDVVYTHEQTKQILGNRKALTMPRFDNGTPGGSAYIDGFKFGAGSESTQGSGQAADKKDFKNDLDKQYNLLQIIEDTLRRQEKLSESIQESAKESATAVTNNLAAQTKLMQAELANSQLLLERRKKEVEDFLKENEKYKDFGSYDLETGLITIDWNKINKEGTKETLEYIKQLEELQENVQDAEDKIDEANQTLQEIAEQGKDTYFELQDRLYDAIVDREQAVIDRLSANNDAINDSNDRLISSLQSSLDKQRQERDNANTESDIAEKERRLALLQRDTSGSYALEIKQLQDEIKSAKEDYTDTLVDQAIQQLQDSYDLAAESREREIAMLENQQEWREENGYYWNEVLALLSGSAYGNATDQAAIDQIMALLSGSDAEYNAMSPEQQADYIADLTSQFSEAIGWYWNQAENKLVETRTESINNDDGTITKNTIQKTTYYDPDGSVSGYDEEIIASEVVRPIVIDPPKPSKPLPTPGGKSGMLYSYTGKDGKTYTTPYASVALQNTKDKTGYAGVQVQKGLADLLKKGNIKKTYGYATGGLADYTGPAWLDGTKSRPELVLNAADTANFIQLKSILSDILGAGNFSMSGYGNNTIQVDISFDRLDPNTNIDEVVSKVEQAIIKKAAYRNVNVLTKSR